MPEFRFRSEQEVRTAVRSWTECVESIFDEEFGLCVVPEGPLSLERWIPRLGEPATEKGYHGVSQDSTYYALSLLRIDKDREHACKIIRRVLEAQVRDETSERHGEFKLIYEAEGNDVLDSNTVFFVSLGLIAIVKEFANRVGDDLAQAIRDALALVPPREYEELRVSYTNRMVGLLGIWLSIADMLGDQQMFEVCRRHFNRFYEVNMQRGFPERLSMTYYMVDLIGLSMLLKYVSDPEIGMRSREMLAVFAQELFFFEDRQPMPARRTYNQDNGQTVKWSEFDWVLGMIPWKAEDIAAECDAVTPHGFEHNGGWLALTEVVVRTVIDPADFELPAPRQMRGRFVDQVGYTSYFHPDFTLGTFDQWPPKTQNNQHESDIPVSFAGATSDLVYFGHYSIDAEGVRQTHPGTGAVAMPSQTTLPLVHYTAAQEANVCCVLTNLTGYSCTLKEYGWMLTGLRYTGKLLAAEGGELEGTGSLAAQWIFLVTEEYFAGICPLTHFDPTADKTAEVPSDLHYDLGEHGLFVLAPCFQTDPPLDLKGDNLPAGAILVLSSAKEDFAKFRESCLASSIKDDWIQDGYLARSGNRDPERFVGIRSKGGSLLLNWDYREGSVSRSFNGRTSEFPSEQSAIRLAVQPWGI